MTFDPGGRIDPGRASGGGGGRRGVAVGGGLGGLLLLLVGAYFGVDLSGLTGGDPGAGQGQEQTDGREAFAQCTTGQAANEDVDCRVIATAESLDAVWSDLLPGEYSPPGVRLFTGAVSTGCGQATTEVGPFYCPGDRTAYFDTAFFTELTDRFGASGGPLAQEYVVAHEFGHAVQDQQGLLAAVQGDRAGADSAAVRSELQADCFAGVWAHHATSTPDPDTGRPLLQPLTPTDVSDALSAAASVGDDRIQEAATGRTDPETYTHGTAEQRQRWFSTGYDSGDPATCDTSTGQL
ncbi:KPN_02809 family neutral zinc metallopeptidase [Quadrisphaera sp. KR29]|uniref:KPN_02809 family neutral zinc metallopeptidase n=1 Tax=Quadrisphaera sp. KR29 TaxID=3461391 RepID=UPI0040446C90